MPHVAPFEAMKLRMLNGAHSLLAYLGALHGVHAVRDVMAVPQLSARVATHMAEVSQSLAPIPGFSFETYAKDLVTRFENPGLRHQCLQIAMDGSQKLPQRIFAPALDLTRAGVPCPSCALAFAAWAAFLRGHNVYGAALPLEDPKAADLRKAARQDDPFAALSALMGDTASEAWTYTSWRQAVYSAANAPELRQV